MEIYNNTAIEYPVVTTVKLTMKLALAVLATVSVCASVRCAVMAGGWTPLDTNDGTVQTIAQFAVGEIPGNLVLVSVAGGESQVVNGKNYRLRIVARDPQGVQTSCSVVVWDRAGPPGRFLTSHICSRVMVS